MQTVTSAVSMHFAWGTQPYCGLVRQPITSTASAVDCPRCRALLASRHPDLLAKSPVKSITLTRAEGNADECGKPVTVTTWDAASATLTAWARTAPQDGGHDKCDFKVEWGNGLTYQGRLELRYMHALLGVRLDTQIASFLRYVVKTPGFTSELLNNAIKLLETASLG